MLALLTALAPLIGTLGLDIIDFFVKDAAKNAQAKAVYNAALAAHNNDSSVSAGEHHSYDQQVTDLEAQAAKDDAAKDPSAKT